MNSCLAGPGTYCIYLYCLFFFFDTIYMHKFAPNPSPVAFPNPTDHSKRYGVSLLRGGTLMAMYCFWYLHLSTGERPEGKKKIQKLHRELLQGRRCTCLLNWCFKKTAEFGGFLCQGMKIQVVVSTRNSPASVLKSGSSTLSFNNSASLCTRPFVPR